MLRFTTVLLALIAVGVAACDDAEQTTGAAPGGGPPPAVGVSPVVTREVTPALEFVARVEAMDSVELEARVTGFLVERAFAEGAMVEAGQLMFRIEPEPYEVAVAARTADVERMEATLLNASQQRERMEELVRRDAQPQARLDEATAAEDEARAARNAALAALRQAEIDLSYTEISAPFAGQFGRAMFSEGAVVGPTSGTLGRLVRLDPIFVAIPVTDRQMLEVRRAQSDEDAFQPFLRLSDGSILDTPGEWAFFDPEVSQTTSTITVRAAFENPTGLLLPGQFVTVLVRSQEPAKALVIPQVAVQRDQSGEFVLVVDQESRVQEARVSLGERIETDWVVEGGLEEGQNVIVEGLQKVRPGVLVEATGTSRDEG